MSQDPAPPADSGACLLFQTENTQTRVQMRLIDGELWLKQRELNPAATLRKFRTLAPALIAERKTRPARKSKKAEV